MRFASLGSGSRGNSTVLQASDKTVMIDCGFSLRETVRRLALLDLLPADVDAILVTHEHSDHIKGVGPFARKYKTPIYLTSGTFESGRVGELPEYQLIEDYQAFNVGAIKIKPVAVPHDAREPAQFSFEFDGRKIGILTDIGSITPQVIKAFGGCHGLLLEANHDLDLLARGPYPPSVKARVSGPWGHLNNGQTCSLLSELDLSNLQYLVVGHISTKNNSIEAVERALEAVTLENIEVLLANQDQGFTWLGLAEAEREPYNEDMFQSLDCIPG